MNASACGASEISEWVDKQGPSCLTSPEKPGRRSAWEFERTKVTLRSLVDLMRLGSSSLHRNALMCAPGPDVRHAKLLHGLDADLYRFAAAGHAGAATDPQLCPQ